MGGHDRCCAAGCNNDKRNENNIKRNHVEKLVFHAFPKNEKKRDVWIAQLEKGLEKFSWSKHSRVCSNHFQDGKLTISNPYPTLFLCPRDFKDPSPKKRKKNERKAAVLACSDNQVKRRRLCFNNNGNNSCTDNVTQISLNIALKFHHINTEANVKLFTGLPSPGVFKLIFTWLEKKAKHMQYWEGEKIATTSTTTPVPLVHDVEHYTTRKGRSRSLSIEQEFLLVLMRLRMGLLVEDLAFRFCITPSQVSSIFTTWIKLMSKELGVLIVWPSKTQVKRTLPHCFRKMYPNCRVIIDCTEVYTETPTALDVAAALWSEYKHHHTLKFLVAITPRGAVSWISPVYGGRASDIHIVRDSGFLDNIERYDIVMADRGFKIREDLLAISANLAIPPSSAATMQMRAKDVKETSQIANVRIHVERAIRRIKVFRILKQEMPVSLIPLADNILSVCAALCNLLEPLVM